MKKIIYLIICFLLFLPCFADEGKILPSEIGLVQKVQYVDLDNENITQAKQAIEVKLLTGQFKGETVELENMLTGNPYYDINLQKNTKVILHAEDNGNGVEFSIEDIKRSGTLGWLSLIFCGLLIYVGRKKGLFSLISIGVTILFITNMLLYKFNSNCQIDNLLMIISFLGGSLGIIIAILLFDRKAVKGTMMSRVFAICMFIIQLLLFVMFKFYNDYKITFDIWELFNEHKILLVYLGIINFITFTIFALDKIKAISGKWRYNIVTLLGLCFAGGSIGGLLSMYIFKHKTNVDYFTWGIPIIMIMQVVVSIFLVNIF